MTGFPLKCRKTLLGVFLFGTSGESTMRKLLECSFLQQHNLTKLNNASGSAVLFWRLKKQGNPPSEYPPETLYHICCGIQRYLRWNGKPDIDILSDSAFADFKSSLDAEMKQLQASSLGSTKRQAEPLSREDVELLWRKKLLGDATPQSLLDTVAFMNVFFFALRSGKEHRPQIKVVENDGERPYLIYTEDISKNRPGGLKGRKQKPKVVIQHADALYLQPLTNPSPICWYSSRPYGHNWLASTVARLCKEGIGSNHSLRVTNATWLYDSHIDEQLIMERTGHLSSEGVRITILFTSYKEFSTLVGLIASGTTLELHDSGNNFLQVSDVFAAFHHINSLPELSYSIY